MTEGAGSINSDLAVYIKRLRVPRLSEHLDRGTRQAAEERCLSRNRLRRVLAGVRTIKLDACATSCLIKATRSSVRRVLPHWDRDPNLRLQ